MLLRLQMTISSCCVRGDEHEEVQVLGVLVSAAMTLSSSASQFKKARQRYSNTSCLGPARRQEDESRGQGPGAHRAGDLVTWSRAGDVVAAAGEGPGSLRLQVEYLMRGFEGVILSIHLLMTEGECN
jgi:hypothetical protein